MFADVQYILAVFESDIMKTMPKEELHRLALILMYSYLWLDDAYVPSSLYFINVGSPITLVPLKDEIKRRLTEISGSILLAVRRSNEHMSFHSTNEAELLIWVSLILRDGALANSVMETKCNWQSVMSTLGSLQDSELISRMHALYLAEGFQLSQSQLLADSGLELDKIGRRSASSSFTSASSGGRERVGSEHSASSGSDYGSQRGVSPVPSAAVAKQQISPLVEAFFSPDDRREGAENLTGNIFKPTAPPRWAETTV